MATPGQPTSCKPACNELAHNGCRPGAANAVPGDFFGVSRALCRVIAPKREYSVAMASENSIDCLKLCKTRGGNPRQQGGTSDSSRISIIPTGAEAAVCAARRGGNWRKLSAILLSQPRGALHWRGTSGVAEIAEIRSAVSAGPVTALRCGRSSGTRPAWWSCATPCSSRVGDQDGAGPRPRQSTAPCLERVHQRMTSCAGSVIGASQVMLRQT